MFDIIKRMMYKILKEFFPMRHSCKNLVLMKEKNNAKGVHMFCATNSTMSGELCSFVQNNHDQLNSLLEW